MPLRRVTARNLAHDGGDGRRENHGRACEYQEAAKHLVEYSETHRRVRRNLSALPITETELSVIAALAQIGLMSVPVNG